MSDDLTTAVSWPRSLEYRSDEQWLAFVLDSS